MVRSRRAKGFAQKRAYGNAGKQRALCSLTGKPPFSHHRHTRWRLFDLPSSALPNRLDMEPTRRVYTLHLEQSTEHSSSGFNFICRTRLQSLTAIANACSLTLAVWSKTAWHKKMGKLMSQRASCKRESAVLGHFVSDVAVCGTFDAGQERQKEQHDAFTAMSSIARRYGDLAAA